MYLQPYLLIFAQKHDGALRIPKLVRIRPKSKLSNPCSLRECRPPWRKLFQKVSCNYKNQFLHHLEIVDFPTGDLIDSLL
jgi:hypothetical protein